MKLNISKYFKVLSKLLPKRKKKATSDLESAMRHNKFRFGGIKILDLYIIRKFLGSYIFSILLLLAIVVVFDINEKLDSMLNAPLKETVFGYFMNFLPYFANQFSPLFTFIAVIFFTSKMADHSEIIAILSSGVSFKRLLLPYMFGALVIAGATFVLSAYIIPPANVKRIAYTNKYVKNKKVDYGANIQLMVKPGVIVYISRYDNNSKMGFQFSLEKFDKKVLKSRLTAQSIKYDTLYNWTINDYTVRDFKGLRETMHKGSTLDTIIPFEPKDFLIASNDQEMLTTPELKHYIQKQKERGVGNIKNFEIELHRRYASTAAAFILTLIGMSLSARKQRGGTGVNLGVGIALSFSYILFSTVTATFAVSGYTSPMLAMWIPNIIFIVIAIFLYRKAAV